MLFALLAQVDALNLPIGPQGSIDVKLGQVVECATGRSVGLDDIAVSAQGKRFVYVGETHDNADAHLQQAAIIDALGKSGRDVIVGFEMFTRPKQLWLDRYSIGRLSEPEFLAKSDWAKEWGFDFALYKPIFDAALKHRARLVALNVPRDWVRAVGRGGPDALPTEAVAEVPTLFLGNTNHRLVFDALMGGHPGMNPNVYAAQVLWDEAMADSALKYLRKRYVNDTTIFVVIAGNGHVMYGQGISYRVERQSKERGVVVVTVDVPAGKSSVRVSKGIADYVIGVRDVVRSNSATITSLQ